MRVASYLSGEAGGGGGWCRTRVDSQRSDLDAGYLRVYPGKSHQAMNIYDLMCFLLCRLYLIKFIPQIIIIQIVTWLDFHVSRWDIYNNFIYIWVDGKIMCRKSYLVLFNFSKIDWEWSPYLVFEHNFYGSIWLSFILKLLRVGVGKLQSGPNPAYGLLCASLS